MKPLKILASLVLLNVASGSVCAQVPAQEQAGFKLYAYQSAISVEKAGRRELTPEFLKYLADLGYRGIEMGPQMGDPEKLSTALARMQAAGIEPVSCYSMAVAKPNGTVTVRTLPTEVAELVRDRGFVCWIAPWKRTPEGVDDAQLESAFVAAIRAAADKMAPYHIDIALYNHWGHWRERVVDLFALAKKVDRPNVGITFNLFHHLGAKGESAETIEATLREVAPLIKTVAANGARTDGSRIADFILPMDDGDYDLAGFLDLLEEVGYRGFVGIHGVRGMPPEEELERSAKAWRNLTTNK